MTGDDIQVVDICGVDGVSDICLVNNTFIQGAFYFLDIYAQTTGCVGLRVCVDNQHTFFQGGQRGAEIHGGGSLTDTAFLVR